MAKQARRILYLKTPLGEDKLMLGSFSGTEGISQLFKFQLQMASESDAIAAKDIVGKSVTWRIQFKDGPPRDFNGLVSRFSGGDMTPRSLRSYRAEIVPWLWFLTRTSNCRIFPPRNRPPRSSR